MKPEAITTHDVRNRIMNQCLFRRCGLRCLAWSILGILFIAVNMARICDAAADQLQPPPVVRDVVAVRLRFGLKDKTPTDWSGSAKVSAARLVGIYPWPINAPAKIKADGWQTSTWQHTPDTIAWSRIRIGETGVILRLAQAAADATVEVSTRQGNFRLCLAAMKSGRPLPLLGGAVEASTSPIPRIWWSRRMKKISPRRRRAATERSIWPTPRLLRGRTSLPDADRRARSPQGVLRVH